MWGQHFGEQARRSAGEVPFSELRQQLVGSLPQRKLTGIHFCNSLRLCRRKVIDITDGMVEETLVGYLKDAGFAKVESTVVKEAVWAENPYYLLPVAGDKQKFCVIQAWK